MLCVMLRERVTGSTGHGGWCRFGNKEGDGHFGVVHTSYSFLPICVSQEAPFNTSRVIPTRRLKSDTGDRTLMVTIDPAGLFQKRYSRLFWNKPCLCTQNEDQ